MNVKVLDNVLMFVFIAVTWPSVNWLHLLALVLCAAGARLCWTDK